MLGVQLSQNLDALSDDEILSWLGHKWTDDEIREVCGVASSGAPRFGVLEDLKEYARLVRHSRRARLAGNGTAAWRMEAYADDLYRRLPATAKW